MPASKTRGRTLFALGAVLVVSGTCLLFWQSSTPKPPTEAPKPAPASTTPSWSPLEKSVLMRLDALPRLKNNPAVKSFLKELDADPKLKPALEHGMTPEATQRFQSLVQKYSLKPGFSQAIASADRLPSDPKAPGCEGPSAAPIAKNPANVLETSKNDDACGPSSKDQPLFSAH